MLGGDEQFLTVVQHTVLEAVIGVVFLESGDLLSTKSVDLRIDGGTRRASIL